MGTHTSILACVLAVRQSACLSVSCNSLIIDDVLGAVPSWAVNFGNCFAIVWRLTVWSVMQVETFNYCPELSLVDDMAHDNVPYTKHVYKRLAQTIPDPGLRTDVFELLRSMLHPNPQFRASINDVLASSVFHCC